MKRRGQQRRRRRRSRRKCSNPTKPASLLLRTLPRTPPLYSSSSEDSVPLSSVTMIKQRTLNLTTSGLLDIFNYIPQQLHKMHSCVPYPPVLLCTTLGILFLPLLCLPPHLHPSTLSSSLHTHLYPLPCLHACSNALFIPFLFSDPNSKDLRGLFLHVPIPPHSPLK